MPVFIDIHDVAGVTTDDVARAHLLDLHVQSHHGVDYVKYWVNEKQGKIFCMCNAPTAEAADAVHREAHGMSAARIMELTPEMAEAFMGAAEADANGAVLIPDSNEIDPGTRTILFTDIVGSTDMTQRLGDEIAFAILQTHDRVVRAAIAGAKGREVKHTGDGIMAAFVSAAAAVRCAIEIQEKIRQSSAEHPNQPLQLRIGLAAGEPIEHHHDLFGATVQLAARLCARANPEQIMMSNAVAELCIGKALPMIDAGAVVLKGFDQPVHVHCIDCVN
jgi:class 3 adenylate cyclase